jgi:hypothetical protein
MHGCETVGVCGGGGAQIEGVWERAAEVNIWALEWQNSTQRDKIIVHNEKRHNSCCLRNIAKAIKSRRMKWAEHVERVGKIEMNTEVWLENLKITLKS